MTKKLLMIFILITSFVMADFEKIYLNEDDIKTSHDKFYLHEGGNVWLETSTLRRDKHGLFTFESELQKAKDEFNVYGYQKTWRCPYCNQHWPIGQKCQNSSCPSKY